MFDRDFTLTKYKLLCKELKELNYKFITFSDFFSGKFKDKVVLMRHDIDNVVDYKVCKAMALFENENGIRSTYYARVVPKVFNLRLLKFLETQGHEVGYHYEVLNLAKGDLEEAHILFDKQLEFLRRNLQIKTICQHGGLLGNETASTFSGIINFSLKLLSSRKKIEVHDSRTIWKNKDFVGNGIIGDAYLSLDYDKVKYFSDTGLAWNNFSNRVLDKVKVTSIDSVKNIKTTDELIDHLRKNHYDKVSLLVHPANWIESLIPWFNWRVLQFFRHSGKKYLFKK